MATTSITDNYVLSSESTSVLQVSYFFLYFQIQLRHKLARLLGYANYADYAIDLRMANSSAKVCASIYNFLLPCVVKKYYYLPPSLLFQLYLVNLSNFPFWWSWLWLICEQTQKLNSSCNEFSQSCTLVPISDQGYYLNSLRILSNFYFMFCHAFVLCLLLSNIAFTNWLKSDEIASCLYSL